MTRNRRVLLAAAIIVGGIVYLTVAALPAATMYYHDVSEALDPGAGLDGRRVRVWGTIVRDQVDWRPDEVRLAFSITDGKAVLPVVYRGPKPDLFDREGVEAVAEGFLGADGVFVAERLLLKCPSKYEGAGKEPG